LAKLVSGRYPQIEPANPHPSPRMSKRFLMGMLPDNIRLEAHFTHLAPGAPPEPIGTHKHTEIWFIHEGTARLMTAGVTRDLAAGDMGVCIAGDQHTVYNASQTEPASYFVLTVGPPE
jgi:mannose-6-phosphate isomerase-like protein (cupin superfamily)